jgi:hypothetical protein
VVNSSQGGGSKDTWVVGETAGGDEADTPENGTTALRQSQPQSHGTSQTQRQSMG